MRKRKEKIEVSEKINIQIELPENENSFGNVVLGAKFFGEKDKECMDFNRELESIKEAEEDEERRKQLGLQ